MLHPLLIDGGLQLCALANGGSAMTARSAVLYLPIGADRITICPGGDGTLLASARRQQPDDGKAFGADVSLRTADGKPVVIIESIRFAPASPSAYAPPSAADGVLYRVDWDRAAKLVAADPLSEAGGSWLICADQGGFGAALADAIAAAGGQCRILYPGPTFARLSDKTWVVNPAANEHFQQVLDEWAESDGAIRRSVLHCWSLDTAAFEGGSPSENGVPDILGSAAVLHLVQSLVRTCTLALSRLVLLTRGAKSVAGC
jgi:hypothetical protein